MTDKPTLKFDYRNYKIAVVFSNSENAEVWLAPPNDDKILLEPADDMKGTMGLWCFDMSTEAKVADLREYAHKFVDAHIKGRTCAQIEKEKSERQLATVQQWWEKPRRAELVNPQNKEGTNE